MVEMQYGVNWGVDFVMVSPLTGVREVMLWSALVYLHPARLYSSSALHRTRSDSSPRPALYSSATQVDGHDDVKACRAETATRRAVKLTSQRREK